MAVKSFCDICEKEIELPDKDKYILTIKNSEDKLVMLPVDMGADCKEKIIAYLKELRKKEVGNGKE